MCLVHLVLNKPHSIWMKTKNKRALFEALEKIKAELMLLGFISLLLTVLQSSISKICIPASVGATWHPCDKKHEKKLGAPKHLEMWWWSEENRRRRLDAVGGTRRALAAGAGADKCTLMGKVPLVSLDGIHQLHLFIFDLALFHVLYCVITLALGRAKMRRWKTWEKECRTEEYKFSHDPERFRLARETTFGRRHLTFWTKTPILLWTVCFFRQFIHSVPKVDYLTLRHGFIMAHLAPQSQANFNFQNYIKRSLEKDFKVVVGISPPMWLFAVFFLLFNTHGWYSYLWLPFIPLIIILLVGAKLQVIITKMGQRIQQRNEVVKGVVVVEPGDDLFWFSRPRLLLFLLNFVLFQNAFQLAFFSWTLYEFGLKSCFHERVEDIIIRITMGIIIQVLCSYVTLPLYALVTQMGSNMKPTIFNERIATALKDWHHTARKRTKESQSGKTSPNASPMSSRPGTPSHHGMSPIHLLRGNHYRSEMTDSPSAPATQSTQPYKSYFDDERWGNNGDSQSPPRFFFDIDGDGGPSSSDEIQHVQSNELEKKVDYGPTGLLSVGPSQHEINVDGQNDFSFVKRLG